MPRKKSAMQIFTEYQNRFSAKYYEYDSSDDDMDDFIGNERHGKRDVGKTNSSSKRAK